MTKSERPNYSLDFTGYILQSSTSSSCIYGTNFVLHSVSDTRQQTYRNNLHTVCVMRQTDRVHSTCGRATHVITYTHQQTDTLEYGDYTAVRTCKHSQTPRQAREQTRDRRRRTPAHDTVRRHTYTPTHLPTHCEVGIVSCELLGGRVECSAHREASRLLVNLPRHAPIDEHGRHRPIAALLQPHVGRL